MAFGAAMTPEGDVMTRGIRVVVETVLLGVADTRLTFQIRRQQLGDGDHPDDLARTLGGLDRGTASGALLHSTSWRFSSGGVLLTYAALPDPDPSTAHILGSEIPVAASPDPLAPSPNQVGDEQVAAHACRHLAYLRHTDPVVAAAASGIPALWDLIGTYQPDVAGLLVQPAQPQYAY
jgi:hypothetical protein